MTGAGYSVVIPTHNRKDTLLRVIAALERQDAPGLLHEVIVVDDASTDGTAEALGRLHTNVPLVALRASHGGPGAARNRGAEAASGRYLLFLCDDIEAEPRLLRKHHERRANEPEPHCVVGRVDWPTDAHVTWFMRFVEEHYHFGFGRLEGLRELPFHALITANASMSRELFLESGGFDESFPYGFEDTDLGLRLSRAGVRILYAPDALGRHHHRVDMASYCRRQEMVGRSAVRFAAKHPDRPEVTALDRLPTWGTLRGITKLLAINGLTVPVLKALVGLLAAGGARPAAARLCHQVLAYHYYHGARQALRAP